MTTVYYNRLGLRALFKPEAFARKQRPLPRPARPPPKLAPRFDVRGSLPPDPAQPPPREPAAAVGAVLAS